MLAALLTATQSLTRIPVPSPRRAPDADMLGQSAIFYPAVGMVLGLAGFGLYRLLGPFLSRDIVMLLVLVLWVVLTGALHDDGLADAADAFGSQQTPERILVVLKDSRIGTYGTLAIVLSTLLRWRGLVEIDADYVLTACVATQVIPRTGILYLAAWAGPATAGSGGSFAGALRARHLIGATLVAGILVAVIQPPMPPVMWAVAACLLILTLSKFYFRRRLGGITGDCLGAAVQLQEIAILLTLLVWTGLAS